MKNLITIRAKIRRTLKAVDRSYRRTSKASMTDEDSNSYDSMQRYAGQCAGLQFALAVVEDQIFKERMKRIKSK